jgi:hypothetical protein
LKWQCDPSRWNFWFRNSAPHVPVGTVSGSPVSVVLENRHAVLGDSSLPIHVMIWKSPSSAVAIATAHGLDDGGVGVRVPVDSRISTSPYRPDELWGPPTLLSNEYQGALSQEYIGRGLKLTIHLQLELMSRKHGSIQPLPHTSSQHGTSLPNLDSLHTHVVLSSVTELRCHQALGRCCVQIYLDFGTTARIHLFWLHKCLTTSEWYSGTVVQSVFRDSLWGGGGSLCVVIVSTHVAYGTHRDL